MFYYDSKRLKHALAIIWDLHFTKNLFLGDWVK